MMRRLTAACITALLTLPCQAQDENKKDAFADEKIERAAIERLYESAPRNEGEGRAHVNVTSFNQHLLLTGEAPTAAQREEIGRNAANVPGVRVVSNEIVVGEVSGISSRTTDSLITSDVRSRLRDSPDVIASQFKVVTESGVVYLMGKVRHKAGAAAAEVASTTRRVVRVVLVYDYID